MIIKDKIKTHASVLLRTILPLFISLCASQITNGQFALTRAGAMAVLNNSLSTTRPTNPIVMARVPASTTPLSRPGNISTGVVGSPNDKAVWFTYRAPLTWYSAFFDYKTAAESITLPQGLFANLDPGNKAKSDAVAYLTDDKSFTPFPIFKPETLVMTIRSNNPLAVQLSKLTLQQSDNSAVKEYRPITGNFYFEVPLDFTNIPPPALR